MAESDLLKNTVTNHHAKHHGGTAPTVHSKAGSSKTKHRDEKHVHHNGEKQSKGRKTAMKNRIAQTLTSLAFTSMLILGLASSTSVKAAILDRAELKLDSIKVKNIQLDDINLDEIKLTDQKLIDQKLLNTQYDDYKTAKALLWDVELLDSKLSKIALDNLNTSKLKSKTLKGGGLKA